MVRGVSPPVNRKKRRQHTRWMQSRQQYFLRERCRKAPQARKRRKMHWIEHIKKTYKRSRWKNAEMQHHKLDRDTEETEMASSHANCHTIWRKWTRRAAWWRPRLVISTRTQRKAGRPTKRWEDDLNEFVIEEETETTQSNDLKNNDTWLIAARHLIEWKKTDKQNAQQSVDGLTNPTLRNTTTTNNLHIPPPTTTSNNSTTNGDECSNCNITSTQNEREDIQSLDWHTWEMKDSATSSDEDDHALFRDSHPSPENFATSRYQVTKLFCSW